LHWATLSVTLSAAPLANYDAAFCVVMLAAFSAPGPCGALPVPAAEAEAGKLAS